MKFVILPTYNEAGNIEKLANELHERYSDLNIVIVDDNSPDGTGRIADELAENSDRIHVIHRSSKLGLGTAYIAGYKLSLQRGAEYICTMDADFSHPPEFVGPILERAQNCDVVIGSRYVEGGKTVNFGYHRIFLSRGANFFAKSVLGLKPGDCTSGFRCYRRKVLESIDLDSLFSNGYSFLIELLYHCQKHEFVVGEVPFTYVARVQGLSKISRKEILNAFRTIFRLRRGIV